MVDLDLGFTVITQLILILMLCVEALLFGPNFLANYQEILRFRTLLGRLVLNYICLNFFVNGLHSYSFLAWCHRRAIPC